MKRFVSALASTAFLAAISSVSHANIIVNGDFEAGNTGFTSSYGYVTPGGVNLWPEARYTVDTNPRNSHSLFYSMGDHTTGSGKMMIINGAGTTGIPVWQGTLNFDLTLGTQYDFSAWAASVYPDSLAQLTFAVDGISLGTFSPTANGDWTRFFSTFTATQARPVFTLLNSNGNLHGNDFAIDDLDVFFKGTTTSPSAVPEGSVGWVGAVGMAGMLAIHRSHKRRLAEIR